MHTQKHTYVYTYTGVYTYTHTHYEQSLQAKGITKLDNITSQSISLRYTNTYAHKYPHIGN